VCVCFLSVVSSSIIRLDSHPSETNALPGGENVHMLGLAAVCWAIWKAQNRVCFNRKPLKHVSEIVFFALAFMNYWAGLHPEEA
jgi:hypothetical protein